MMVVHDILAYYEEFAFEIADGAIAPYGAECWFYDETEAGNGLLSAHRKMKATGAPR